MSYQLNSTEINEAFHLRIAKLSRNEVLYEQIALVHESVLAILQKGYKTKEYSQ